MSTKKKQWSEAEEKQLFELHLKHRNKWAQIAKEMPGKDYNCIKNKFYSTVRKGLRKINKYITSIKKKSDPERFKAYKTLQELFVVKLIAVADDHFDEKYEVKARAVDLASGIQRRMIQIACAEEEYLRPHPQGYEKEEKLLADIQEFNKNCKRRKGKKKTEEQRVGMEESQHSSNNHLLESEIIEDNLAQQIEISVIPPALKLEDQGMAKTTEEINVSQNLSQTSQKLIFSGFLGTLEKKESSSSGNFASLAAMRTEGFLNKFTEFLAEDNVMVQSHGNLSQSGSWIYESSSTTRQLSKKMSNYMTEPSPHPTDPYSPYTFNNLMKKKNITTSNMFDDKSSCADILENERTLLNNREQNVISFVEQIPMFQSDLASFLVRSADLRKEYENARELSDSRQYLTNSLKLEQKPTRMTFHQLIPVIENRRYEDSRSFASEYAFTDSTAIKTSESQIVNNNSPEVNQP